MLSYDDVKDLLEKVNPYEWQGKIKRPELFLDRKFELHDARVVCEQIVRGRTGGVLVIGGRGAGKSSFLEALHRELDQRKVANTILPLDDSMVEIGVEAKLFKTFLGELTAAAQKSGLIAEGLGSKIRRALGGLIPIEELGVDVPGLSILLKAAKEGSKGDFGYIMLRDGLRDFMTLLGAEPESGKGAVLLLDEGDMLTKNKVLLELLRNVFQEMDGIGLVVAGTSQLLAKVSEVFSPMQRFFRKVELGPFPREEDVFDAIGIGLRIVEKELAKQRLVLFPVHRDFDMSVAQLSGGAPVEVNLLSYFAFEAGSRHFKYESNQVTLFMKVDKSLLDTAIGQLRPTKDYTFFMESLSESQTTILRLLSRCKFGASHRELTFLVILDEVCKAIDGVTSSSFVSESTRSDEYESTTLDALNSIGNVGEKFSIRAIATRATAKPIYLVEDQWVRASFKYGSVDPKVDLEFGFIAHPQQALVFGDPVASIIDTIFLPQLIHKVGGTDSWRVNNYPNDGSHLRGAIGRKILNCAYQRSADDQVYHMAYQIRMEEDVTKTADEMDGVLSFLRDSDVVTDFRVVQQ